MNIPDKSFTFLFTDIEGSTKLSQEFSDKLPVTPDRHHAILQNAMSQTKDLFLKLLVMHFAQLWIIQTMQ